MPAPPKDVKDLLTFLYDQSGRLCNLVLSRIDPPCDRIFDFNTRLVTSDQPGPLPDGLNGSLWRFLRIDHYLFRLDVQQVYLFNNLWVVTATLDSTDESDPRYRGAYVESVPSYRGDLYDQYNVRPYPERGSGIGGWRRAANTTTPAIRLFRKWGAWIRSKPEPVSYSTLATSAGCERGLCLEGVLPLGVRAEVQQRLTHDTGITIPDQLMPDRG